MINRNNEDNIGLKAWHIYQKYMIPILKEYNCKLSKIEDELLRDWTGHPYILLNPNYTKTLLKDVNIYGIDQHSAYPYALTFDMPYGELLDEEPDSPNYHFMVIKVSGWKQDNKYPAFMYHKLGNADRNVTAYTKNTNRETIIYTIQEEWDFLTKYIDFRNVEILSEGWMKKAKLFESAAWNLWNDKENKDIDKGTLVATVGMFRSHANSFAFVPVNIVVVTLCSLRTKQMVVDIVDAGNEWLMSVNDSVYWIGKDIDMKLEYGFGKWDRAWKGNPCANKFYGASVYCRGFDDKDGNRLSTSHGGTEADVDNIALEDWKYINVLPSNNQFFSRRAKLDRSKYFENELLEVIPYE